MATDSSDQDSSNQNLDEMRDPSDLDLRVGRDELVIRNRYEVLSILDDVMIAVFFIVGSLLFFSASTETAGVWLFLLGSIAMLARPLLHLSRRVHLQRIRD
ncbi:MAG: YrhK family protein [Ornithinimicrobium sp.]